MEKNILQEIRTGTEFNNFKFEPISRFEQITYNVMYTPQVGDKVYITNPKSQDQNVGVINSFCRDGKVRVYVGGNLLLDRKAKNLLLLDRDGFAEARAAVYYNSD